MSHGLEYVLTGARGGPVRTKLLTELGDSPRNPNQLASRLDLQYETVSHHLDVLDENDLVDQNRNEAGGVYLLTEEGDELLEEIGQAPLVVE